MGGILLGLLAVAVVGSMLAIGAVHFRTVLVVMPLAVAAGVIAVAREGMNAVRGPGAILLGLAVYSFLQSLPLPAGLLARLDASSLEVWSGAMRPLGRSVEWASLSLDPGATRIEALKWLGYAGVFVAAAALTRQRDKRWVPALIFLAALLAALVTLGHRFAAAESVFGIYRPVYATPKFAVSPLLNPNNLAGYLNLGAFCGIGSMVARRPILAPWVIGLGVAIIIGVSAVSGSRAGFVSLALGVAATLVALRFVRFEGRALPRRVLGAAALAMVGGGALFLLGADRGAWQSLFEEGMKKLSLIGWTQGLVSDHFWFGVGRGAFETTFPAYRADVGHHVYQFPENFVMQWCCEWGVPVAAAALGGLGWFLRPTWLGVASSPTACVSALGVLVLLLHNLLDLGLELAAVGIALFAVLGFLWGGRERAPLSTSNDRKWLAAVIGALAATIWLVAVFTARWSAIEDRRTLAAEYRAARDQGSDAASELRRAVQEAVTRHPGDPFLPLIGALVARAGGENALPWLARAIERDPMAGRPHLVLAAVLAERGASSQALLAVRMAVEREYGLVTSAARLAATITADPQRLQDAAAPGPGGAALLTTLAVRPELSAHRRAFLERACELERTAVRPRQLLAQDLLSAMEKKAAPCAGADRSRCSKRVEALAESLQRLEPQSGNSLVLRARLAAEHDEALAAWRLLDERCPELDEATDCFRWQVIMAHRLRDVSALERAAEKYLGAACVRPAACTAAASWLGDRYEQLGERGKAVRMFERAAEEGDSAAAWLRVAALSEALGLPHAAAHARNRAKRANDAAPAPEPRPSNDQLMREMLEDKAP